MAVEKKYKKGIPETKSLKQTIKSRNMSLHFLANMILIMLFTGLNQYF
jgi:hypothetical protein